MIKPPEEQQAATHEGAISDETHTEPRPLFRPSQEQAGSASSAFTPLEM